MFTPAPQQCGYLWRNYNRATLFVNLLWTGLVYNLFKIEIISCYLCSLKIDAMNLKMAKQQNLLLSVTTFDFTTIRTIPFSMTDNFLGETAH